MLQWVSCFGVGADEHFTQALWIFKCQTPPNVLCCEGPAAMVVRMSITSKSVRRATSSKRRSEANPWLSKLRIDSLMFDCFSNKLVSQYNISWRAKAQLHMKPVSSQQCGAWPKWCQPVRMMGQLSWRTCAWGRLTGLFSVTKPYRVLQCLQRVRLGPGQLHENLLLHFFSLSLSLSLSFSFMFTLWWNISW